MARVAIPPTRLGRLHEVMAGHVDAGAVPGLVTLVSHHGEVHVDAIGSPAVDGAVPMGRDTIFRISSMTKPITAVAAMVLVEECGVRLDDPIDEWIPELADRRVLRIPDLRVDDTVPAQRPITLRDLLTFRMGHGHGAGRPRHHADPGRPSRTPASEPDRRCRRASLHPTSGCGGWGRCRCCTSPANEWHYNTGSDVLGILIARASGQSFEPSCASGSSTPSPWPTPASPSPPTRPTGWPRATSPTRPPARRSLFDPAEGGAWTVPPPSPPAAPGWCPLSTTTLAFAQMLLAEGDAPGGPARAVAGPRCD